jgi:predicted secreted protein
MMPLRASQMWRFSQFAVASAVLAARDAGLQFDHLPLSSRTAVCFGTSAAGMSAAEPFHARFLRAMVAATTPPSLLVLTHSAPLPQPEEPCAACRLPHAAGHCPLRGPTVEEIRRAGLLFGSSPCGW